MEAREFVSRKKDKGQANEHLTLYRNTTKVVYALSTVRLKNRLIFFTTIACRIYEGMQNGVTPVIKQLLQ